MYEEIDMRQWRELESECGSHPNVLQNIRMSVNIETLEISGGNLF